MRIIIVIRPLLFYFLFRMGVLSVDNGSKSYATFQMLHSTSLRCIILYFSYCYTFHTILHCVCAVC